MESSFASSKTGLLAPGFRFHPTDEELVFYYLRRKICGKPVRFDAISEIDIYKVEPWDLPGKSRLKSRDLEWYFFSALDRKYGNGSKTNRATDRGYWKTTGKDRPVYHRTKIVGMKKTLVYHQGRAPRGERTNWVMHEYRLVDEVMQSAGFLPDSFVLCRVFRKSGSGPKNGENYGAPLAVEEWEDDDLVLVTKNEYAEDLPVTHDACPDAYLDEDDLEQILSAVSPSHEDPLPPSVTYGDENHYIEESTNLFPETQEVDPSLEAPLPLNLGYGENYYVDETTNFIVDEQQLSVGVDENTQIHEQPDGRTLFNLPVQDALDAQPVKREYIGESSYTGESSNAENPVDVDYFLDKSYLDAMDNSQFGDETFVESNDFKQPAMVDTSSFDMLDEYLQYFDAIDDNGQHLGFDYSDMLANEDIPSEPEAPVAYKDGNEGIKQELRQEKLQFVEDHSNDLSSSSKQGPTKFGSDFPYPFSKHASQMLGNIPAPPAFASDYPTKDATLRLGSASSSSIRVTAGIIHIRDVTLSGSEMDLSLGKHGHVNVVLSFSLSRVNGYAADTQPASTILSDKSDSAITRAWFYYMFMWVLFLTMSFKIGSFICAN